MGVPLIGGVDAHAQDFGWNFGGGLYIVPLPFFAIRGDVRRFQTGELLWDDIADLDLPLPDFDLLARYGRHDLQVLNCEQPS